MLSFIRSKMSASLPLLAFATVISTVLLGFSPGANAYAAAPPSPHATTGILTRAGTVDPTHPPAPGQGIVPQPSGAKDARFDHGDDGPSSATGKAPLAAATPLDDHDNRRLLENFNGVSSLDSAVTNFGAEFEPPDQGLCEGNGFVVEPVNSAFTIYRTNGKVVAGPFNVNVLFDEGLTEFTSDPRCYFDPATHTWFAIILFINDTNTAARTDIAVNTSGNPTTPWTVFHLDATDDGTNGTPSHPGCPCLGDQPLLGIDSANLYISTNEFSILGPQFNGAQIYAISKDDLIDGAKSVHFVHFDNLSIGGAIATSVQPAINTGRHDGDAAEYFLNSLDPNGTTDNRIGVWALTNQRPDTNAVVGGAIGVKRVEEVFGSVAIVPARVDGGLHGGGNRPADAQVIEMHKVDGLSAIDQIILGNGVNLSAVKLRSQDGELIGADVEVGAVDAQEWLIAQAGAAGMAGRAIGAVIGGVQVEDRPGRGWITRRVDGNVGASCRVGIVDEENDGKPGMGCRVKVAAWVAGKLGQPLVKEDVDVERTGNDFAIGAVDREGGIHRLDDKPVAFAQPLIGRLELSPEIGDGAVQAADAIKVFQQPAVVVVIQRGSGCQRRFAGGTGWAIDAMIETRVLRARGLRDDALAWGGGMGRVHRSSAGKHPGGGVGRR